MLRSCDFKIASSQVQSLILGVRDSDCVVFKLSASSEFTEMKHGTVSIDIIYKDSLLYSCDVTIPIENSTSKFKEKVVHPFRSMEHLDTIHQSTQEMLQECNTNAARM